MQSTPAARSVPRQATPMSGGRNVSIRSRLLMLVALVLLPAVAAAVWLVAQTYSAERQANQRLLTDTARALSQVVDRELAQRAYLLRGLALSPMLDDAPELPRDTLLAFEQQARRTLHGLAGWLEVRSSEGLLLDTRRRPGETLLPNAPGAARPLSAQPLVLPLPGPGAVGLQHATLAQPVERDGRVVLNLGLAVLPQEMQRIIDAQHLPADWVGAIIDGSGTVVAHHPGGSAHAGRAATPDLRARIAAAREGLVNTSALDGQHVTSYFSTTSQGWTYVTGMPREQFDGVLPNAVVKVALAALAMIALALLSAVWVSRSISRPVHSLKQAAAQLQAGLPVQSHTTGIAECDDVASALAAASASMHDAKAELERQVAQAVTLTRQAAQRVSHNQRVEALGRLTGGVAHDFNNLLGVISNSAHLIQRQTDAPAMLAPLAATLRAVDVGSRLTQHLLRFSGRQPVRPRAVHLATFLPEVVELMKTVLGKSVAVSLDVAEATRSVMVDPNELELALVNLALNARDAIRDSGHVWLQANNAEPQDQLDLAAGDYVVLALGDDGRGLEESLVERVFEPFFSTKPVGQGTGLGLSQVHGFCVQAGGMARLASTPGLGTTVTLVLPAGPLQTMVPSPAVAQTEFAIRGRRVLLVEDNVELADATASLLASFGAAVERATNAPHALQVLGQAAAFDVVLSDVVMPGVMDGIALARRLQREMPTLPVVLISGYSGALADAGDLHVLRKPCAPQDLLAALHQAMAGRAAAAQ